MQGSNTGTHRKRDHAKPIREVHVGEHKGIDHAAGTKILFREKCRGRKGRESSCPSFPHAMAEGTELRLAGEQTSGQRRVHVIPGEANSRPESELCDQGHKCPRKG